MITQVGFNDFVDAFRAYDRYDNFGYDGLKALFDYLENYEEETGQSYELDVIALCCEYTMYENLEELNKEYGEEFTSIEEVQDNTQVIAVDDDSFIIQCY